MHTSGILSFFVFLLDLLSLPESSLYTSNTFNFNSVNYFQAASLRKMLEQGPQLQCAQ